MELQPTSQGSGQCAVACSPTAMVGQMKPDTLVPLTTCHLMQMGSPLPGASPAGPGRLSKSHKPQGLGQPIILICPATCHELWTNLGEVEGRRVERERSSPSYL